MLSRTKPAVKPTATTQRRPQPRQTGLHEACTFIPWIFYWIFSDTQTQSTRKVTITAHRHAAQLELNESTRTTRKQGRACTVLSSSSVCIARLCRFSSCSCVCFCWRHQPQAHTTKTTPQSVQVMQRGRRHTSTPRLPTFYIAMNTRRPWQRATHHHRAPCTVHETKVPVLAARTVSQSVPAFAYASPSTAAILALSLCCNAGVGLLPVLARVLLALLLIAC